MPRDSAFLPIAAEQDTFARTLLWESDGLPAELCGADSLPPRKRFTVYRNNVFASLTACLAARFPVVARLVGEEFFAAMARVFVAQCPPASPALLEYGDDFPAFLQTFEPVRGLPYLADVARLECHVARAYHAADARPVDSAALTRLGDEVPDARLDLHPSCAILLSQYPVLSIWETNTRDATVKPIDAAMGGEAILIARPRFDVCVVRLATTGAYAFIAGLKAGHSLELSAEIATEVDPCFNLASVLLTLFQSGAVVGVRTQANRTRAARSANQRTIQCAT